MFGNYLPLVKPPELADGLVAKDAGYAQLNRRRSGKSASRKFSLVSCIGNLGKVGLASVPVATNQQINAIKPDKTKALPEFIFYLAQSPEFKRQLYRKASGTTVPIINKSKFSSIRIALTSLSEQKRIVAILDEAFAGIETAIANTEKNLANARELFEGYLNSIFNERNESG